MGTEPNSVPVCDQCGSQRCAIEGYRRLELIGRGGFGDVWRAESDCRLPCALKVLSKARDGHAQREFDGCKRYLDCCRAHDHLMPVYPPRETPWCYYYAMPLADNRGPAHEYRPTTLRTRMTVDPSLHEPPAALRLVRDLADAVAELHASNLRHCDLKPENILFVRGQPRIGDLSLVVDFHAPAPRDGTRAYMRAGRVPDDVCALGKILYELVTWLPADRWPDVPARLTQQPSRALSEAIRIINRACLSDARESYASAGELREDLAAALQPPPAPPPGGWLRTWRRCRRAVVACGAVLALAIGGWWLASYAWYEWTGQWRIIDRHPGGEVYRAVSVTDCRIVREELEPQKRVVVNFDYRLKAYEGQIVYLALTCRRSNQGEESEQARSPQRYERVYLETLYHGVPSQHRARGHAHLSFVEPAEPGTYMLEAHVAHVYDEAEMRRTLNSAFTVPIGSFEVPAQPPAGR